MNQFIFGRGWIYQDETTDGGEAGGGAAPGGGEGGENLEQGGLGDKAGDAGAVPEGGAAAGAVKKEHTEDLMLDGIKKALADTETAKKTEAETAASVAKKKADDEFAEANKGKTPEELAAAQAARAVEAKKRAEAEEAAKLKAQKADDFHLSPQMKKHLSQEAQQRFHSLHRYAKEKETQNAQLTETNAALAQARDDIIGVLQETRTSQDQLAAYLNFNSLLQSGDPGDLKTALGLLERQRSAIYKALGMEAPGIDLLAEFPDLQRRVEDDQIAREDALELANARRREQMLTQNRNTQGEQARSAESVKRVQNEALAGIEKWSRKMAGEDIDYKKKEEKLLESLQGIIREYPPNLWLPTFQRLYQTIAVMKPAPSLPGDGGTLRPSGARPGAKNYTELTPDALRAGLGYPPRSG